MDEEGGFICNTSAIVFITLSCRWGPLVRLWYMRYETKHSYFKGMSQVVHNFKNIAKSLAIHHQRFMCYRMSNKAEYLRPRNIYGSCESGSGRQDVSVNVYLYF